MLSLAAFSCFLIAFSDAALYIENVAIEANPSVANISISFAHDKDGNSITNMTVQSFVTVTKLLVYFKVNIAEGQKASGFEREWINIVVDVDKLFKGSLVNPFMKAFIDQIKKFMDFKVKFPMPPGIYRFVNVMFDASFASLIQETRGNLGGRVVGKVLGDPATKFMGRVTFFGGLRRSI